MAVQVYLSDVNARIPVKSTDGAVGYDVFSAEDVVIPANARRLVNTGFSLQFSHCCSNNEQSTKGKWQMYARIAPRSGLAVKGIDVGAGVCDADYQGVYKVLLVNSSGEEFRVRVGDRIAQLIFEIAYDVPAFENVKDKSELRYAASARGDGGFGSTG